MPSKYFRECRSRQEPDLFQQENTRELQCWELVEYPHSMISQATSTDIARGTQTKAHKGISRNAGQEFPCLRLDGSALEA